MKISKQNKKQTKVEIPFAPQYADDSQTRAPQHAGDQQAHGFQKPSAKNGVFEEIEMFCNVARDGKPLLLCVLYDIPAKISLQEFKLLVDDLVQPSSFAHISDLQYGFQYPNRDDVKFQDERRVAVSQVAKQVKGKTRVFVRLVDFRFKDTYQSVDDLIKTCADFSRREHLLFSIVSGAPEEIYFDVESSNSNLTVMTFRCFAHVKDYNTFSLKCAHVDAKNRRQHVQIRGYARQSIPHPEGSYSLIAYFPYYMQKGSNAHVFNPKAFKYESKATLLPDQQERVLEASNELYESLAVEAVAKGKRIVYAPEPGLSPEALLQREAIIQDLNESQKQAIIQTDGQVLSLIQGPPGTGKTKTIVAFALSLYKQGKKVLVTAPSNEAVKCVAQRMCSDPRFEDGFVLDVSRARENFFETDFASQDKFKTSSRMVEKEMLAPEYVEELKSGGMKINNLDEFTQRSFYNFYQDTKAELLSQHKIILSTCAKAISDSRNGEDVFKGRYDWVVIDEATQASYQDVVQLLSIADRALLVGDQQQLSTQPKGPTIGPKSVFDYLVKRKFPYKMLNQQYRMHGSIAAFPNDQFYDGQIASKYEPQPSFPELKHNVCFVDITQSYESRVDTSFVNECEAKFVINLIKSLVGRKIPEREIGFVSPYKAQVDLVRSKLAAEGSPAAPQAKTVDAWQGGEQSVIILSTVRSNAEGNLGFVENPNRMNVALTRAKHLLVVVGKAQCLAQTQLWSAFLRSVEAGGLFLADPSPSQVASAIL